MKAALQVSGNLTVCPTPLRLDAYDGCTAGCVYCFARIAALSSCGKGGKTDTFGQVENRSPHIGPRLAGVGKSSEAAMRRLGIPVHLGGMADPFQPCEADRRVALGFLRECAEAQAPLIVSTKFTVLGQEPWRSAWEAVPQRLLQVSLIAADDALLNAEPGAATWQERLAFVRDMAPTTPTVIRVQPYIRGVSERTLNVLCEQAAEAGARAIIVEGLKLPSRVWAKMDGTLRGAFGQAYQTPAAKSGADRDYPWAEKFAYQLLARKTAKAHGLGHYAADNALRWLGDSANCCATDLMAGEVGTWRANWGHVTEEAMRAGEVRFEWVLHPMMQTAEGGSALHAEVMETNPSGVQVNTANGVKARIRSEHYGTGKQTLAAWYRYVWNQTRSGRGPQAIVPNLIATHRDENGDAVYRFVLPENLREAVQRATGEEIAGGYMTAEEATHAPQAH